MSVFYKGFLIKQGRVMEPGAAPKYIATLQGVRFTSYTITGLHEKIDRNSHMIAEMSNQSFKQDGVINTAMFDPSDNLIDDYEIARIVHSYAPREVEVDYA